MAHNHRRPEAGVNFLGLLMSLDSGKFGETPNKFRRAGLIRLAAELPDTQASQVSAGFLGFLDSQALAAFLESAATQVLAFQVFQARLDLAVRPDSQDFLVSQASQGSLDSQVLVVSQD